MSSIAPALPESFAGDRRLAKVAESIRSRISDRMRADALELPLLPHVAMQVLALASRQESDAAQLADLIRRDQAMSVHVLRVVNSPHYRSRASIDSIPQALSRLGFAKIRHIALIIACKQRVFRAPGFDAEVHRSFRHSLATALFAQEIASARKMDEDEAFLAGLLHDVGRPVLLQAVSNLYAEPRPADAPAVMTVVAEMHARVGSLLARKWRLPMRVCEAIAYHHDPCACPNAPLPMLVSLADDLAVTALMSADQRPREATPHWTLSHLNLAPEALAHIVAQRAEVLQDLDAVA